MAPLFICISTSVVKVTNLDMGAGGERLGPGVFKLRDGGGVGGEFPSCTKIWPRAGGGSKRIYHSYRLVTFI